MARGRVSVLVLALLAVAGGAQAQFLPESQLSQERREYWVDPSTGLMWAAKDAGRFLNWRQAARYCLDLRLARFDDWRLPSIAELRTIQDRDAREIGRWKSEKIPEGYIVKERVLTADDVWTADRAVDDQAHVKRSEE